MKKIFIGIIAITIILVLVSDIYAQKSKGRFMKNRDGIEKLNLSEVQKTQFDEIRFAHQEKVIDLRSELQKNKLELKKLFSSTDVKEADILSLTEKNNKIKADIQNSRVKMWFDINKILDENQKKIWKDNFNNFSENIGARFQRNEDSRNRKDNFKGDRANRKKMQN